MCVPACSVVKANEFLKTEGIHTFYRASESEEAEKKKERKREWKRPHNIMIWFPLMAFCLVIYAPSTSAVMPANFSLTHPPRPLPHPRSVSFSVSRFPSCNFACTTSNDHCHHIIILTKQINWDLQLFEGGCDPVPGKSSLRIPPDVLFPSLSWYKEKRLLFSLPRMSSLIFSSVFIRQCGN